MVLLCQTRFGNSKGRMTLMQPIGNFSEVIYNHFGDFSDVTVCCLFRFAAVASAAAGLSDTDVPNRVFTLPCPQHLWRPVRRDQPLMVPHGQTGFCSCRVA